MILLAKVGLGMGASLLLAGAYVFHEGVVSMDVDEKGPDGAHVHVWVPATAVSAALRLVPSKDLRKPAEQMRPYLPVAHKLAHELEKYPNAELVDVRDGDDHVRIATVSGKLQIDANSNDGDVVHVTMPVAVLNDVVDELQRSQPGI